MAREIGPLEIPLPTALAPKCLPTVQVLTSVAFYRQRSTLGSSCGLWPMVKLTERLSCSAPEIEILGETEVSTGLKIAKLAGMLVVCAGILFSADTASADTAQVKHHHKIKKVQPQAPPLPSGPTGPIQQMPLDSMAPVAPHVTFENGQLTIDAPNSTLGDILRAVRKQTGAEIDIPDARERVATTIGPAPAQEVMAELLNGSRFNYVLLGSPQDPKALTRVVLVARSAAEMANHPAPAQPTADQANADQSQPDMSSDTADADTAQPTDDNSTPDQNADQPAADDQQNQGVKTPQELLQEMQQRQLQLQQQNNPGLNRGTPQQPPQQQPQ